MSKNFRAIIKKEEPYERMQFDTLKDYSAITGVGVVVTDDDANILFHTHEYAVVKKALRYMASLFGVVEQAKISMIHAGYLAARLGGVHIFACPRGFTYFAVPIIRGGKRVRTIIGGPTLMTEHDDYIDFDVAVRVASFDRNEVKSIISAIPVFDSKYIDTLAAQLFVNAYFLSDTTILSYDSGLTNERYNDYLAANPDFKEGQLDIDTIEAEQKLIHTLEKHDDPLARALLNDLLGRIILHSGTNLELTKNRVLELIILLSRAAARDGADADWVAEQNRRALDEIDTLADMNELIMWLNDILDGFTGRIFNIPHSKSSDYVRRAISYIKENYNRRLTLEDVAATVYVSPSSLSKSFREKTGKSFKEYLNNIRVEESKELLKTTDMSLMAIAEAVGFEDQSYFTKVFKKYAGMLPGRFRKNPQA